MAYEKDKGFTLVQIIFVVGISIILAGMAAAGAYNFYTKQKEGQVTSDVTQLEAAVKSYYMVNSKYPAKYAVDISAPNSGLDLNKVFKTIKSTVNLSDAEIVDRFKPIDMYLLMNDKYTVRVSSTETFLVDTLDGSVYYAKQFDDTAKSPFAEAKLQIQQSSGLNIALKDVGKLDLTANGNKMTQVNTSLTVGNNVVIGGTGTMVLALVKTDLINNSYQTNVQDISNLLTGTNIVVGDLKSLGDNKVLVHYTNNGSLSYAVIQL